MRAKTSARSAKTPSASAEGEMDVAIQDDWAGLIRALASCEREVHSLLTVLTQRLGLSEVAFRILSLCRNFGANGRTRKEVRAELGLTASNAKSAIDQLRDRGCLTIRKAPERRTEHLVVTAYGSRLVDELFLELADSTFRLHQQISRQEIRRGTALLSRVEQVARESHVPHPSIHERRLDDADQSTPVPRPPEVRS